MTQSAPKKVKAGKSPHFRKELVVATSVADLRRRPSHSSELLSQALMGTRVSVLSKRNRGTWLRVELPDGYRGWMRSWHISENVSLDTGRDALVRVPLSFVRVERSDKSAGLSDVVLGSKISIMGVRGRWARVLLPDGRRGWIKKKELGTGFAWKGSIKESIVKTVFPLLGIQYLWGGKSVKGFDCSGLIQLVFELNGVSLPRDSREQVRCGSKVSWPIGRDRLSPCDLLFFGAKRKAVSHVGLYVGNGKFIHSQGRVKIGSVRKGSRFYDETLMKSFRGVRRVV